ncbi:MAG: hypothetical protein Kow0090_02790 [Myxococcota bacterium]
MNNMSVRRLYALFVSGKCNLKCDYCYFPNKNLGDMSLSTAGATLDFIANSGDRMVDIGFFGVEPTMNFAIIEWFLENAPKKLDDVIFSLNTNGTLLDERRIELLKDKGVRISLSLDGSELTHNRHRKTLADKGSFNLVSKNLPLFVAYSPPVYVRITLSPDNAPRVGEALEAVGKMGFSKAGFSLDFTAGYSTAQLAGFHRSLVEYARIYAEKISKGEVAFVVASLEGAAKRTLPERGLFCGAGVSLFSITSDGSIHPCWRYAGEGKRRLGDVFKGIDVSNLTFYESFDNGKYKKCRGCSFSSRCARCLWVSEKMAGGEYEIAEAQCRCNKALEEAGEIVAKALPATASAKETDGGILITDESGMSYLVPIEEWKRL